MLIADLYFDDEEYEEAEAEYAVYIRLYPSASNVEYAHYRLLMTHVERIDTYDRDQTHVYKALESCENYKRLFPSGEYTQQVDQIEIDAKAMLAKHEFYVGRFYYRTGRYYAANSRLTGVVQTYPESEEACKSLYYIARIHLKSDRKQEAVNSLEQLVAEYPECEFKEDAEEMLAELVPEIEQLEKERVEAEEAEPAEPEPADD